MRNNGLITKLRDERGITAVVVAVCMVALFGAAMLTVDAGSLWTTRRTIITGTDAAVLNAAQKFASGAADPCSAADVNAVETGSTSVLTTNHPSGIHNSIDTPNGFEVTLAQACGTFGAGEFVAGKVRYDARLQANRAFAGLFGFGNQRAFSSSTAAWGFVTAIGNGLRPINVCDQVMQTFPDPLPAAPAAPYYPHYKLWTLFQQNLIDETTYDSFFGTDGENYPSAGHFYEGTNLNDSAQNPNRNKTYVAPAPGNGHHTIHRFKMPDPNCGVSPGNRIWVDFTDPGGGAIGASRLTDWILRGYPGTVSIDPHDCNPADNIPTPENCGSAPGDKASIEKALGDITCAFGTVATSCGYQFPILVVRSISQPGANAEYDQRAFLFVVLRGFSNVSDSSFQMDFEMLDVMSPGVISATPPSSDTVPIKGFMLCGADHAADRCGF